MSDKPSSLFSVRDLLGLLFMAGGLMLQVASARHSPQHDIGLAAIFAGFAIRAFGSYFFVPAVLFVAGTILGLGPITWEMPGVALMALGFIIGFYGWWRNRKSQASDKRSA